jgi:hypothetical protein
MSNEPKTHKGSCHCGAVRFEATVDATRGSRCNCTVCTKVSGLNTHGRPDSLKILEGESELTVYEWGFKTGKRYFCKHCGVTVFGRGDIPELGGAYVSINLNALDDVDPAAVAVQYWDGRHNNWDAGTRDTPWPIARA